MNTKYDRTIYAVYVGKDHSVKVFAYPARQRDEHCIESKVYLHKSSAYANSMIKLPSNEFYKTDFEKIITLVESNVTYFTDKERAIEIAKGKVKKQYKKTCKEIEDIKKQILALEERFVVLNETKTAFEAGLYDCKPIASINRKDAEYY